MSYLDSTWCFTNSGPDEMLIWLEPWADELILPPGSAIELRSPDGSQLGEIEQAENQITLWASCETVRVFVDGELQRTTSASVTAPRELTKEMLQIFFENQPSARLGGMVPAAEKRDTLWQRFTRWFAS